VVCCSLEEIQEHHEEHDHEHEQDAPDGDAGFAQPVTSVSQQMTSESQQMTSSEELNSDKQADDFSDVVPLLTRHIADSSSGSDAMSRSENAHVTSPPSSSVVVDLASADSELSDASEFSKSM
jgi:hypothetical protein